MRKISGIIFFFVLFYACKLDPKIIPPLPADNLEEIIPDGWPQPYYNFSNNQVTESKFILGRSLFYENMLSKNDSLSCGSCHQQFVAFANSAHKFSHGIKNLLGNRNAPSIFNVNWHTSLMHDGGINSIEVQPLGPISNPVEMAESIDNVLIKLNNSSKYKALFKDAFGSDEITSQKMLKSMTVFMGMMYSYNSKYDKYKRGEDNVAFTETEARGYSLFQSKCASCHVEPLLSDFKFRSIGLAVDPVLKDSGRWKISKAPQDIYKFKTPSLKNIAKTGPYMHDGRYATLEQCLDHYTMGITNMLNVDPLLQSGTLNLSTQDKMEIITFLNTLTDYKFIGDKRFADPNFE
jgi:cytochrome c peroxidase